MHSGVCGESQDFGEAGKTALTASNDLAIERDRHADELAKATSLVASWRLIPEGTWRLHEDRW